MRFTYFLVIEVARSRKGTSISQRNYVLHLLKDAGMLGYKLTDTPKDPNSKLVTKEDCAPIDKGRFQ